MTRIMAVAMLFFSSVCFAQPMKITGRVPSPTSNVLYRIQVGAYSEIVNAENVFNRLQNAGLNPVYENHLNYRCVILAGINAMHVPFFLYIMNNAGFSEAWISEDKTSSHFSVVSSGNGAVSVITDNADKEPLAIVQTIPSFTNRTSTDNAYPANAPIVFFFNDKIYVNSIDENINISADGKPVDGTITINEGSNGFAVLTLTPNNPLSANSNIAITIKKGLRDDGGNQLRNEIDFAYIAQQSSETTFAHTNFGFEAGDSGIVFTGDGAVGIAKGSLVPFESDHYAAISTGNRIVSGSGTAIGSSSSQILLGPIQQPFSSLTFQYDFISAEFNEYVGSKFDDNAMVTIYGPKGTHTEIITNVNKVRLNNTRFHNFPGMPDNGDEYTGHTGWKRFNIENIDVGYPAYIIFTVTDVGDTRWSSILAVDALELK